MTAKDFFRRLNKLEAQIKSDKFMAQCFREMAEGMSSPTITDMPKSKNCAIDPMFNALAKAWQLDEKIKRMELELQRLSIVAFETIEAIEDEEYRIILARRYLQHDSFKTIANALFYSERWVYKLHGKALQVFEEQLNQKEFS